MCNCIKDLEKRLFEHEQGKYKKPIRSVLVRGRVFSSTTVYTTDFMVNLEGQVKQHSVAVKNTYCQFCGEKLDS